MAICKTAQEASDVTVHVGAENKLEMTGRLDEDYAALDSIGRGNEPARHNKLEETGRGVESHGRFTIRG